MSQREAGRMERRWDLYMCTLCTRLPFYFKKATNLPTGQKNMKCHDGA